MDLFGWAQETALKTSMKQQVISNYYYIPREYKWH